ncbi:hypothetical protein COO60DRAFT_1640917 [Scenedesmus sp. NREL 46B-D3]|nr:hypothetical protein COO60DRAFT_1640917 [Scenedesmus sp. NREL 46B-D3]
MAGWCYRQHPLVIEQGEDAATCGHPSSQAVRAYVQAYAEHFGLLQHIRFRCQLLRLQPAPQGGWAIIYLDRVSGLLQVVAADVVVMATGTHAAPNVPVYKGMQHFRGLQLHSSDLTDASLLAGKHVVVVGGGRTALDLAAMAAARQQAARVTWLYRQAHWPLPLQVAPCLPLQSFLFSQLLSLLLPPYYNAPASQQALAKLTAPLQRGVWRWLQRSIAQQCGLAAGLLPSMPLQQDLLFYGQVVDAEWSSILQQQQQQGGRATAAEAGAAGVITGASRNTAALSVMPSMLLRVLHGSAAADSSSRKGSRGADGSNTQQPQSAGSSSSSRANGSCKGVWRGFLHRQSAARSPRSTSSTAMSGAAAGSGPPMSRTPVSRPQLDGTSASTDAKAAEAEDGRGACCLKSCNGSSGSSSGSACAVVPLFGEVERLRRDGLLLRSGGAVGADVLLYCTGYNRSYEFIDEGLRARLGLQKDGLPLFRHMLPPQLPGLAFVGCEAGSFNTPLTAGLQAEWLAAVVAGQVELPSQQAMQEDVRKMTAWSRRVFPPHRHRASAVQLFMLQYHEQLLRDMQLAPPRHGWLLQALTAQDYRFVFTLPLEGGARQPARPGLGGRSRPGRRLAGPAGAAAAEARRESAAEASSSCAGSAEEGEGHPLGAASVAAAAAQALQATARFAAVQPASAAAAVDAASSGGVLRPRQQQPEAAQQQQQCWASMSEQDAIDCTAAAR